MKKLIKFLMVNIMAISVFANVALATSCIGDKVWEDTNKNGIQDANEYGIAGVKVYLLDNTGKRITGKEITTDTYGAYEFCQLDTGDYFIEFEKPIGYKFTQIDAGDDGKDSDVNEITGKTEVIKLQAGEDVWGIDAGVIKLTVSDFVTRFYVKVLQRDPDQEGLDYWVNRLQSKELSGADIAIQFVFSDEIKNKELDDVDYLSILYNSFFDREADDEGLSYWLDQLENAMDRYEVLKRFIDSQEFKNIAKEYNINAFDNVNDFVTRFYSTTLDRNPDLDGLLYWRGRLKSKELSGSDLAKAFIDSKEFKSKNLDDEEYLSVLYKSFFDREAQKDLDGLNYWLDQLDSGMSKEEVLERFIDSKEFSDICSKYGIRVK